MANVERAALIALLGQLGAQEDATVLQAARELHRQVHDAGTSWEELIRAEPAAAEPTEEVAGARSDSKPSADHPPPPSPDRAETARLIERLLARKELSTNLREQLTEMKRTLAEGSLDAMDSRYIRALAKRLGV
jgi:hypothetical protein